MSNQSARKGNFISRYVDPIRNAKSMEGTVLAAETIAKIATIILTSIGFGVWGFNVAAQYTDWVIVHWAIGLIFAAGSAWITDMAFSHFLENCLFQFFAFWKFDWFHTHLQRDGWYVTFLLRPIRWTTVTAIVVGSIYADFTSIYTLRSPIAEARKDHAERVDFSALRTEQQRAITAVVGPIDKEIRQVRADIAAAERNAVSGNAALQDLASKGNTWAKSQLAAKKAKATRADKKRLASLQAQRDKAYADITASTAQERNIAIADDQAAQASDAESKAAITTMYTGGGLWTKMLTILFRLFLVVNFLINTPNWDANRDGVVDGDDVTAAASGRSAHTTTPPHPQGFPAGGHSPAFAGRRRAGFVRHDDPPESRTEFGLGAPAVPPTVPVQNAVAHCATTNNTEQSAENSTGGNSTDRSPRGVLADVSKWKKYSNEYYKRSITQKRPEKRNDNRIRYESYRTMLEALGVQVGVGENNRLTFRDPDSYDTSDDAIRIVEAQYTILWNLQTRSA